MKALDYIKKGWTQGSYACDTRGCRVDSKDIRAVKWCALGAIRAVTETYYEETLLLRKLFKANPEIDGGAISWNDSMHRTHEEVIKAFERAGI